ncbi:hypothetical protein [Halosolutus gelatinilyticus]|uniref:hypothetical protein n=1 Tax=Halosolutus gelatinilyticus TaxID=2931975 RepID=UPI001FF2D033|nr:hypothetical protein [Halosolutus gelatinilyticus]
MSELWHRLQHVCDSLDPGTVLVTPVSERSFEIEAVDEDRIAVRFRDSGEDRSLRQAQFDVLIDRLDDGPLSIDALPPGVEPYAAVLSLSEEFGSDGETLSRDDEATAGESPHLVPPEEARTRPERVHDDAVLLADLLDRLDADADDLPALDTETLTDLYVLLSDVQRGADRLRRGAREPLLDRLGPEQRLHGRFGTIRRTTRERRHPKDDEVVLDALDEHGIPHEWVLGVDREKLDVVLAATDLDEDAVYDVDEQVYVQKTGVDEGEKVSRLQGLADRLADADVDEGLHEELADLEQRIDEALSAG